MKAYIGIYRQSPKEPGWYQCRRISKIDHGKNDLRTIHYVVFQCYWNGEEWDCNEEDIDEWYGDKEYEKNTTNFRDKYSFD